MFCMKYKKIYQNNKFIKTGKLIQGDDIILNSTGVSEVTLPDFKNFL